jgi:hypothetical protein
MKRKDAAFIMDRVTSMTIPCLYCGALADRECADPKTGYVLENQAAHNIRMREAGVL